MSFNLGRAQNMGLNLVLSHATISESEYRRAGMPSLAEQDWTPEQMLARARFWMTQAEMENSVEAWAMLAFTASAFAGRLMMAEESQPHTGDESMTLAEIVERAA